MASGPARVVESSKALREAIAAFDPSLVTGGECAAVAEALAVTEKACAAARVMAASRAVDCGAHKEAGVTDPVAWLARQGGTTGRDARGTLELAKTLDTLPATRAALLDGSISVAQAKEIAGAEAELAGQERELVAIAEAGDLTRLRDEARERRLARTPVEDLHQAQISARRFRHWRDRLGMVCFTGALPPETGIPFVNRIEREAQLLRRAQGPDHRAERFEAHAADALLALTAGGGSGGKPRTELVIVCDLFAWRRGHAHEGEHCHIVDGGPVPVPLAKALAEDAFLKTVVHDGKDIQTVHHAGRRYTAELRTALDLGPVPAFSGRACIDCARRYGLEYDHLDPVANNGRTSVHNVKARCYLCHAAKTARDREAGLLGRKTKTLQRAGSGPPRGTGPPRRDPPSPPPDPP